MPVALLMDNIEIYSAMKVLRDFHQRSKEPKKAAVWAANAEKLAENIRRAFLESDHRISCFYAGP